jgi:AraC-like DNA-binding protein
MKKEFALHDIKRDLRIDKIHAIYYSELKNTHIFKGEEHNFWEFMYVDHGHIIGHIETNNIIAEKGYGILIKPNDFHDVYGNGRDASNIVNFSFVCDYQPLNEVANRVMKLTPFQSNILKTAFAALELPKTSLYKLNLYTAIDTSSFGKQQMIANLLEVFIIDFYQCNQTTKTSDHLPLLSEDELSKDAGNILSVIHSNINNKIDLEFISIATGYSYERIRKIVKQNFNVNLKVLVNQIKINKAKTLLRETDMNISEISEFLGFSRIGYFSDVFNSIVGMRPIDYITSIKNN